MATFLFDKTIFGPVFSRRLGISLGINLLPNDSKICSFDCIYCECGRNPKKRDKKTVLPSRDDVRKMLRQKLSEMREEDTTPDVITFAGNGEPTLHPEFYNIIDDTIAIRDELCPNARIAVLSNSTMLHKKNVVEALKKVDDNILKFDSAFSETIELLDCPSGNFDIDKVIEQLKEFEGTQIIQTMFISGEYKGVEINNTSSHELDAWMEKIAYINPKQVMIYTIARDTPLETLNKIPFETLNRIARRVEKELNIPVQVSG
jgi:wyosine [tRNA(Phe)-imidazoG37] synthetase (radical SAM superfamily)